MSKIIRGEAAELFRKVQRLRRDADTSKTVGSIVFVTMAEAGTIDEVTATEHLEEFERWEPDVDYKVGQLRKYGEEEEKLYKCVQAHRSQVDWTPDVTPALWAVAGDPAEEWPAWSQPIGASDAYMSGDKVSHRDQHWISSIDANVWEPGVYGWAAAD